MSSASLDLRPEHLTPHDLVTYSRCPHEMELTHARRRSERLGTPQMACTPLDVVPERHSPLFTPSTVHLRVNEGRLDLDPHDVLVYRDEGEDDLPFLFPPERTRIDDSLLRHGMNLIDDELGLSGRPDFIVRHSDGSLMPIEYKATHLFVGFHEAHGRVFDTVQAIAECRLIEAMTGHRPAMGVVLYGDAAGRGEREGWVEVPYTDLEAHWIRAAVTQIRADRTRPPVPAERNCAGCEPNRDGLCRYAAARFESSHR
ncbi:MAG: hypothetical protein L3K19_03330 [Thermoplasmata archaeon]|nr:hypothetical protein [Thermoplasmata archaeon]